MIYYMSKINAKGSIKRCNAEQSKNRRLVTGNTEQVTRNRKHVARNRRKK